MNDWVTIEPLRYAFTNLDNRCLPGLTVPWYDWPLDGMQGVRGSNPLSSTVPSTAFVQLSRGGFRAAIAPPV
jgi:hypothetical protein